MDILQPLIPPTDEEVEIIKKELNEDEHRLENHVKLFKEWLDFQPHLPNDIDENFIINYIRWCKFDLKKAKNKLELYVVTKHKLSKFYKDRTIDDNEFQIYDSSRTGTFLPKLTADGYRIMVSRFDNKDPNRFNFLSSLKFACWECDYLAYNDTNSGVAIIYDMGNFTAALVTKLDISLLTDFVNLLVHVLPIRLKQIHFINGSPLAKPIIVLFKSLISDKLKKRMIFHDKLEDLYDYIPKSLLPAEYGGNCSTMKDISSQWEKFLLEDNAFKEKVNKLKLCGPIPEEKKGLFNIEAYGTEGSFRKLQID